MSLPPSENSASSQQQVLEFLQRPESYSTVVTAITHFETHISHVFLTGAFAYKIKKPRRFDFLDFSSLEKRKFYCEQELLLNRRFAPELYLAVVAIYSDGKRFSFEDIGDVVEYAVQMRQFDPNDIFSSLLLRGELTENHIVGITEKIVAFHRTAEPKPAFWSVAQVTAVIETNFNICRQYVPEVAPLETLEAVATATMRDLDRHQALIAARQATHVRALHGDLHLGNICLYNGIPTMFDGIEFNEAYACCDTWADIAFLVMDLKRQQREDLANVVINTYLEHSDDYAGLKLLPLYVAYRACVRAKVACLKIVVESNDAMRSAVRREVTEYLEIAAEALAEKPSMVIAVGGVSGSGKSTVAKALAAAYCGVRIRSDAIRKQLSGVRFDEPATSAAYSNEFSERVYAALIERAKRVHAARVTAILDATFLEEKYRNALTSWVSSEKIAFVGLWCRVGAAVGAKRISERRGDVSDASTQVLKLQLRSLKEPADWKILNAEQPIGAVVAEAENAIAADSL